MIRIGSSTALAMACASLPAAAQTQGGPYWGMMDGGWMWWMPFHGLLWLFLVAAVVVGAVLLIRALWHLGERRERGRSSALELLDARYARGEIDRDEYLQRKRDLGENR